MINSTILKDSLSPLGHRITTFEYVAPRSILAEINTHRIYSRSAASSRAIPISKMIERVEQNTFIPIWNRNKSGMQGVFDFTEEEKADLTAEWLESAKDAIKRARNLAEKGAHKQIVNRVLEPYSFFKGVITGTSWTNLIDLRTNLETAQPEFVVLAESFRQNLQNSVPQRLNYGEWHLPYILEEDLAEHGAKTCARVSAARCARVSYKTFDDDKLSALSKDIALCDVLEREKHFSPFEHQASPDYPLDRHAGMFQGNFDGFVQQRKLMESGNADWAFFS